MTKILKNNERLDDLQFNNLYIIQNPDEYCFTSDAVALANFVHISNFGRMVDLCSGSGVVGILANAKNKIKDVSIYSEIMGSDHCPVGLEIDINK